MAAHFHLTDFPTDYSPTERLGNLLLKALEIGAAPITGTGNDFAGEISAIAAEGADRGSTHGYRLFGIPDQLKVNPLYHGHSEQLSV